MNATNKEGLAIAKRISDNKYNFIDAQGNEQLFYRLENFKDGFARVQRTDGKWNFINQDGKLLSNEWFGYVDYFKNRLARVQRKEDKKCNYINKNGKIISDEWFNRVFDFKDGLAVVERTNGEFCKIDKNGKIVVRK